MSQVTESTSINWHAALSVIYVLVSGPGVLYAFSLTRDVRRDRVALAAHPSPDPWHLELVQNDVRRESWRLAKQISVFLGLILPLVFRPVLRDGPDSVLFELFRGILFFVNVGLLVNSYEDLRFRDRFRREYPGHARSDYQHAK